jgi:hypothetical protein
LKEKIFNLPASRIHSDLKKLPKKKKNEQLVMFIKINKKKHYFFYLPISQNQKGYRDSKPPKKKEKRIVSNVR